MSKTKTNKTTAIAVRKSRIDWIKMIEMAFKRKDWGKTYVLYTYQDVTVTVTLDRFYFAENKATFEIKGEYPDKEMYGWANSKDVNFFLENFSLKTFRELIVKKTRTHLRDMIERDARDIAEKIHHTYNSWHISEDMIEKSEFKEDFKKLRFLSENLKGSVLDSIKHKLCNCLNFPINRAINNHVEETVRTGNGINQNLFALYKKLDEEIGDEDEDE